MDALEIAHRFCVCWDRQDVTGIERLLHPQASFHDSFWGETVSGNELTKYLRASFDEDTRWYLVDENFLLTPNGIIIRYLAFDQADTNGTNPVFNGAEVLTISDGLIMTISDFYCDPDAVQLLEVSQLAEARHGQFNIAPLGLGAKTSGRIKRELARLSTESTVFLDPEFTVTKLANHIGCSVMHLFHVLEVEKQTSFVVFVDECRARFASSLLADIPAGTIDLERVAAQSGFADIGTFHSAFQQTFGTSAEQYMRQFRH
ncbi:MAG: helix-turn-helix domain-containing protein [Gammaproteobacteria bacterium]|nr:helix-turn-helix domain-containing protein [Gammaproteobacteria bacterium]